MKCLFCNGTGELENPRDIAVTDIKREVAKRLRKEGYSIRQIMKIMNYNSPAAVTHLLKFPLNLHHREEPNEQQNNSI